MGYLNAFQIHGLGFRRALYNGAVFLIVYVGFTQHVLAQDVRTDHSDIEAVIAAAQPIQVFTDLCRSDKCVEFECEDAKRLYNEVRSARQHLYLLSMWLREAENDYLDLLESQAEDDENTQARIDQLRRLNYWSQIMNDIADHATNFLGIASTIADLGSNPASMENFTDVLSLVDDVYEMVKSLESSEASLGKRLFDPSFNITPAADLMPGLGIDAQDELNDIASSLNNLKTIVGARMREVRGNVQNPQVDRTVAIAALAQIALRVSTLINESKIAERKDKIEDWKAELIESHFSKGGIDDMLHPINYRRRWVDSALRSFDQLIVSGGDRSGGFLKCIQQYCSGIDPSFSVNDGIPKYVVEFKSSGDAQPADSYVTDPNDPEYFSAGRWNRAIKYLDQKLLEIPARLASIPAIIESPPPSLDFWVKEYVTGEEFQIDFQASACFAPDAWVGFVPSDVEHGLEETNDKNGSGFKYLRGQAKGTLDLVAPDEPGQYDIRMNDTDRNGKEVAHEPITVSLLDANGVWGLFPTGIRITHDRKNIKAVFAGTDACYTEGNVAFEGRLAGRKLIANVATGRCSSCEMEIRGEFTHDGNALYAQWYHTAPCGSVQAGTYYPAQQMEILRQSR